MLSPLLVCLAIASSPGSRDLHKHKDKVHQGPPFQEGIDDVQCFEVNPEFLTHEGHWAYSKDRKFGALDAECQDPIDKTIKRVLVVHTAKPNKWWAIFSPQFSHREFSSPKWGAGHTLQFDIWTGPSYGVHYIFDATRRQTLWAKHFSGEF